MSLIDWIHHKQEKERCGIFPFSLPKWFMFTPCCKNHDIAYATVRLEAVAYAKAQGIIAVDFDQWVTKLYKHRIKQVDDTFFACMDYHVSLQPIWRRWRWAITRSTFERIVRNVGWPIWREYTVEALESYLLE